MIKQDHDWNHEQTYPMWVVVLCVVLLIVVAGWAGQGDLEDAETEERVYCANVTQYIETEGERGWPDYKRLYHDINGCTKYEGDPELYRRTA